MADWRKLAKELALADGRIDEREATIIRKELLEDAVIDRDELEFIMELRKAARTVDPSFNQFFFQVLKRVILKDGVISAKEADWIRKWICRFDKMGEHEKEFLQDLKRDAKQSSAEFLDLYYECFPSEKPAESGQAGTPSGIRRDQFNGNLRQFYHGLSVSDGSLAECADCGILLTSGTGGMGTMVMVMGALQRSPQSVAAFLQVMGTLLGKEHLPSMGGNVVVWSMSFLNHFEVQERPGDKKMVCPACFKAVP